jgi:3-hydroxyacyl-[acyl-carrier-protein] dehydratase
MPQQGFFMQFSINADHPALSGHFPGNPIVPGVVILDNILAAVAAKFPAYQVSGIRKLKFLRTLLPDQTCNVQLAEVREGRLRFECLQAGERIAEGNLLLKDNLLLEVPV